MPVCDVCAHQMRRRTAGRDLRRVVCRGNGPASAPDVCFRIGAGFESSLHASPVERLLEIPSMASDTPVSRRLQSVRHIIIVLSGKGGMFFIIYIQITDD